MTDYELFCPDRASMDAALTFMNLRQASGRIAASYFSVDAYGAKLLKSPTAQTIPDIAGRLVNNWVAQPGLYANIRWVGPTAVPPLPSGTTCTIKVQAKPADYRDWA